MAIMIAIETCIWCDSEDIEEVGVFSAFGPWRCRDCGCSFSEPEVQVVPARRCDGCQSMQPAATLTALPGPDGSADILLCPDCAPRWLHPNGGPGTAVLQ